MTSIGDRLRQERLRRGLDIYQLADQTKINPSMLEAIEADDLEKLPGSFFTRSFVRQYVRALGLDEDEFEPELKRLTEAEERPVPEAEPLRAEMPFPAAPEVTIPRDGGKHPFGALLAFVAIVAVCSLIYAFWQRTRDVAGPEPDRAVHEVAKPPIPSAPAPRSQAQPPASSATAPPQSEPAAVMAEPPAAAAAGAPAVPAGEAGPIRVQVHATAVVWIRMIADGKVLYAGTLQLDESRTFDGQETMNLRVGDAAAAAVTWNGKPIGEIGPAGQPRTVRFTSAAFSVLNPAPPTPHVQNDGL